MPAMLLWLLLFAVADGVVVVVVGASIAVGASWCYCCFLCYFAVGASVGVGVDVVATSAKLVMLVTVGVVALLVQVP